MAGRITRTGRQARERRAAIIEKHSKIASPKEELDPALQEEIERRIRGNQVTRCDAGATTLKAPRTRHRRTAPVVRIAGRNW